MVVDGGRMSGWGCRAAEDFLAGLYHYLTGFTSSLIPKL